jgi:hypothetical protein
MKQIYNIFISIIIIVSLLYLYKKHYFKNQEPFGDPISIKNQSPIIIDINKQFPDVVMFDNDYDGRIGLDKCAEYSLNKKEGKCVEYGITGNAWYFPEVKFTEKNFKSGMNDPNESKLSYPSF